MPFVYEDVQYVRKRGNRREVLDGLAYCTSGNLCATDLEERNGKIISKKRSEMGKQRYAEKNPFRSVDDEKKTVPDDKPKRKRRKKKPTVVNPEPVKLLRVPVARKRRGGARRGK